MFASLAGLALSPGRFFSNITAGDFLPAIILAKNWSGDEAIAGWELKLILLHCAMEILASACTFCIHCTLCKISVALRNAIIVALQ